MLGKTIILILILITLNGCVVVNGPPFSEASTPDEKNALVYVYRVKKFSGGEIVGGVFVNQTIVGKIKNGSYIYGYFPEGDYKIALDSGSFNQVYELKGGEIYYFEVIHSYSESYPSYTHSLHLKSRTPEEAAASIVGTKLIGEIVN